MNRAVTIPRLYVLRSGVGRQLCRYVTTGLIGLTLAVWLLLVGDSGCVADDVPVQPSPKVLIQLSERIYCGSQPSPGAFERLSRLGIRTVVSVDAAAPNIAAASRWGLRYVHIPVGYDGISRHAGLSLARVVRDTVGPIYIHCHHGRHRGPAAAAIACQVEGVVDSEAALRILKDAGTGTGYVALWEDVRQYEVPSGNVELPPLEQLVSPGTMAAGMAKLSEWLEDIEVHCAGQPMSVSDSRREAAGASALLIQEGLHEMWRQLAGDSDARFRSWMKYSEERAKALRGSLKSDATSTREITRRLEDVKRACQQCHRQYRDNGHRR